MKRVKLTHGSARVDENCSKETIAALNNMSKLAYEMVSESLNIASVNTFLKRGWIQSFDDDEIVCLLRKDYELDEELNYGRGLLTPQQNEMVSLGLVLIYNKEKSTIKFMLEDGVNWC